MERVQLVPLARLRPSTYNPRETDPARLELVKLSLRKLGFLLPLYADRAAGELISGHQRHLAAEQLGATLVPVVYLDAPELGRRKALNILFNRATNDLKRSATPAQLTRLLAAQDLEALAAAVPDKAVDKPAFWPCLYPREVALRPLLLANRGRGEAYATGVAKSLLAAGITMPIVVTPELRVVNGLGRLQALARQAAKTVPVVYVTPAEAALADALLNRLSMEFTIHERYADLLRYNSFRRARRVRDGLGQGFVFAVHDAPANSFDLANAAQHAAWLKEHGTSVVDFGAGHLTETLLLRQLGVHVTPFEPFRLGPGNSIDQAASVALARAFLAEVAAGRVWTSVFISSVLNSVPFRADREHVVTICAALCGPGTALYACASSTAHNNWVTVSGTDYLNERRQDENNFRLDYEPGITLGDFQDKPKVQKYHALPEWRSLFAPHFRELDTRIQQNNVVAIGRQARRPAWDRLRAALTFEFDLPYPDGTRMGLVDQALTAFRQRLGVTTP